MLAMVYLVHMFLLLYIVNFSGLDCVLCVCYKELGKHYSQCYGYAKTVGGLLKIEKQIPLFHAVKGEKFWLVFCKNYRQNGV